MRRAILSFLLASAAGFVAAAAGRAAEVRWERMAKDVGPPPRNGFAIAYDAARDKTVFFGGLSAGTGPLADTWEWDGAAWAEIAPAVSPPARSGHALAFDPMRGTVLLFGGYVSLGAGVIPFADTWEWDGEAWREIAAATGPAARAFAAMTFDPARASLLLYGGSDGVRSFADSWEFDGAGWRSLSADSAPGARNGHALATDSAGGRVLLFGGVREAGSWDQPLTDAWEWDGAAWSRVSESGPRSSERAPALAHDPRRGVFVLYGFASGDRVRTHVWSGSEDDEWLPVPPILPSPGGSVGALAYDAARGRVVLVQEPIPFGGHFETWELAPVILAGVTPAVGADAGGDLVSLDGFRVDEAPERTRVRFDGAEAAIVDATEGRLRVRTPLGLAGAADVEIETPAGISRLRDAYRFVPAAVAARYGTVNVGRGAREDVVLVNGEPGDPETRVVEALRGERISVEVVPPSSADAAPFALYAWDGEPSDSTLADAPLDAGRTVFPLPLLGSPPRPRTIWNNAGHRGALGVPTLPSDPAPTTVFSRNGGIARPMTLTFQAVIQDAGSGSPAGWSVSNAVILRIR